MLSSDRRDFNSAFFILLRLDIAGRLVKRGPSASDTPKGVVHIGGRYLETLLTSEFAFHSGLL